MRTLASIRRPAREKIALFAIFWIGAFATIVSIVRLSYSIRAFTSSTDPFRISFSVRAHSIPVSIPYSFSNPQKSNELTELAPPLVHDRDQYRHSLREYIKPQASTQPVSYSKGVFEQETWSQSRTDLRFGWDADSSRSSS